MGVNFIVFLFENAHTLPHLLFVFSLHLENVIFKNLNLVILYM